VIVLGISVDPLCDRGRPARREIVGCGIRRALSRLKNDAGYPRQAVDALLRELPSHRGRHRRVALAGLRRTRAKWMNPRAPRRRVRREYYGVGLDERRGLARRARKLGARLGLIEPARGKFDLTEGERLHLVTSHLGLRARDPDPPSPSLPRRGRVLRRAVHRAAGLVLTTTIRATATAPTSTRARASDLAGRESAPSAAGSLGSFYSFVTLLLGMKFGEHEYKVMGLAPYASAGATERAAAEAPRGLRARRGHARPLRVETPGRRYQQLLEATLGLRFDAIAGGAQRLVEETLWRGHA